MLHPLEDLWPEDTLCIMENRDLKATWEAYTILVTEEDLVAVCLLSALCSSFIGQVI